MKSTIVALAGVLLIGAIADLVVALRPSPARIEDAVMTAAAEKMKQAAKPGDVLVHSPLFSMAELNALGSLAAKPDAPQPEILATRRVIALDRTDRSIGGLGDPVETIEVPESHGLLEVRVFEPSGPREAVLYDLSQRLSPDTMRIERPLGTITSRCSVPRALGGFACPSEADWLYLAPVTYTIDGRASPCVWAHPTTGGVIVLSIPAQPPLPEGARYVLTVRSAMNDDAVRTTPDGAPVRTDVFEGGASKGTVLLANRIGWQETTVAVDPGLPIELRITTPKDGRRHHCLTAEVKQIENAKPRGAK